MKLRALRTLKREAKSAFTFVSERGAPSPLARRSRHVSAAIDCTAAVGDASRCAGQTSCIRRDAAGRNRFTFIAEQTLPHAGQAGVVSRIEKDPPGNT